MPSPLRASASLRCILPLAFLCALALPVFAAKPTLAPPQLTVSAAGPVVHVGPPGAQLSTVVPGVAGGPSCTLVFLVSIDGQAILVQYPLWLQAPVAPPTPPIPPTPIPIPELTGLAKDCRDYATQLVPAPQRAAQAKALAAAYRATKDAIGKGDLKTLLDVQAAQKTANRKALAIADDAAARASPWSAFIARLATRLKADGYVDPAAPAAPMAAVSEQIAQGLEAAQ